MRVLQINSNFGFGSTGVIVKDIDYMLKEYGMESYWAGQKCFEMSPMSYIIGNQIDWKWHAFCTRIWGKQGYASKRYTKKLINWIGNIKPSIVHLHNLHSNYINLNILLTYLAEQDIPTVITLHDCWFLTGKCFHFMECGCNKWQTECKECPQLKNDVKSFFYDRSNIVFNDKKRFIQKIPNLTIVGCSEWISKIAMKSPIFQGKNFQQIYNGVDISIFRETNRMVARNKYDIKREFVILGMANKWLLPNNKKVMDLIVKDLQSDERLIIVGCNEEQKKQLANHDKVFAIGFVKDRKEMAQIYSMADVFVNLTLEDTLPTVNMEAICCGTPVVTYDTGGSPELVKEGLTGYIVPVIDVDAIKEAIKKVRKGSILRENCLLYGKKYFDKNKQYLKYLELYKRLVENHCSR